MANETNELRSAARQVATREDVTTVVMGHTHEPVEDISDFTYLNTGSWTRYYIFEDNEKTAPWQMLREGSYARFPYCLRYALIEPDVTSAHLKIWRERSKQ